MKTVWQIIAIVWLSSFTIIAGSLYVAFKRKEPPKRKPLSQELANLYANCAWCRPHKRAICSFCRTQEKLIINSRYGKEEQS